MAGRRIESDAARRIFRGVPPSDGVAQESDGGQYRTMVTRISTLASLAMLSACTSKTECTSGSEFEPPLCPLKLPPITALTIAENAAKTPAEEDSTVSCDSFKVTEDDVRRYLTQARQANDAHHTLDWSPCYADGEVTFTDGGHGRWSLSQSRTGSLSVGNAEALVLYCPNCEFPPFQ